jgi:hypothetical protein
MIKIIKQTEPIVVENLILTIYGQPGAGKTSLSLSASKPLLFDFDNGMQRALLRAEAVRISSWKDLADLSAEDVREYDTIVIDTVGRMLEILAQHLIANTPKLGRSTGELTLQGYGALSAAFKAWLNKIISYKKDIILVGHAKEFSQNDVNIVRLDAMGSSKDEVLKCSDLLGFLESDSQGIKLNFNPTDKSLGKNCAEFDMLKIPNLKLHKTYFADIIQQAKDKLNSLNEAQLARQKDVREFEEQISTLTTAEEFTEYTTLDFVKNDIEFKVLLNSKANSLGFIFNKESMSYEPTTKTLEK